MRGAGEDIGWAFMLELVPAALFGAATAFAIVTVGVDAAPQIAAGLSGAAAFLVVWRGLRRFGSATARFCLPQFEFEPLEGPMRLVTAEGHSGEDPAQRQRATAMVQQAADELLLDDVLEGLAPESRVVRLFDSSTLSSPGELQARVDRHLRREPPQMPAPDATQALHEALAELRRSLR